MISPLHEILKHVRRASAPNNAPPGAVAIAGGIKDQHGDPAKACITRDDGAWIHFTITVLERPKQLLDLIAYDFEIVFPDAHPLRWLRFDLNLPGHANEERNLRSHMHPGHDDMQVPAPMMRPNEILHVLIDGLRPRDPEKLRKK